jgi:hypothetical protein
MARASALGAGAAADCVGVVTDCVGAATDRVGAAAGATADPSWEARPRGATNNRVAASERPVSKPVEGRAINRPHGDEAVGMGRQGSGRIEVRLIECLGGGLGRGSESGVRVGGHSHGRPVR